VLEGFIACDRDENATVNYLFERKEQGELLSDHIRKEEEEAII
jgi:hypothetical protein